MKQLSETIKAKIQRKVEGQMNTKLRTLSEEEAAHACLVKWELECNKWRFRLDNVLIGGMTEDGVDCMRDRLMQAKYACQFILKKFKMT